jgi:hypothetical protein
MHRPRQTKNSKAGGRAMGSAAPMRGADTGFNFWSFPMSALFSPTALVVPFENLRMTDVEAVGGKNASLGEMISQLPQGVRVPTGFATTAHAFREFLAHDGLADKINADCPAWTPRTCGRWPQWAPKSAPWSSPALSGRSGKGHPRGLCHAECGNAAATFAVRSSATAEDLPDASFAGQQETFLNVHRHRRRAAQDEGGVCQPLQRPRHQLPRAQGLCPCDDVACRPACSAWCAPTWARPA